jgi:radical SAM protein with 4Fe4S-binding SPASM domain
MSAKKITWDKNQREKLSKVLPLDTPLSLNIEASRACNSKCIYCIHSLPREKLSNIDFKPDIMDQDVHFKIVDDCKAFEKKIKTVRFAGMGEPLMNKHLAKMIAYTRQSGICDQIVVFTNALLLTKKVGESLINAGTNVFRISIQGLSAKAYKRNASVENNYNVFMENLKFLYKIRGACKIFIKVLDFAVKKEEEAFFDMFSDLCDEIAIEHVISGHEDVDYTNLIQKENNLVVTGEHKMKSVHVCPYPFYTLTINADGNVSACCKAIDKVFFVGNVKQESLHEMWSNKKINHFRAFQLKHTRFKHNICRDCKALDYVVPVSDLLDDQRERLLNSYPKFDV